MHGMYAYVCGNQETPFIVKPSVTQATLDANQRWASSAKDSDQTQRSGATVQYETAAILGRTHDKFHQIGSWAHATGPVPNEG